MFKKIQGMSLVLHIGFSKPMLHIVGQSETMLHCQAPLDGFILTAPGILFLMTRFAVQNSVYDGKFCFITCQSRFVNVCYYVVK